MGLKHTAFGTIFSDDFESKARENCEKMLKFVNLAGRINDTQPGQQTALQYKLTAVFPIEALVCFMQIHILPK